MNYRERHRIACQKSFLGFEPDVSGSRKPHEILLVCRLAADGLYSAEIAQHIGKSAKAVQKIFRRYNFPRLHNLEPPRMQERADWLGGVKLMKGYSYRRTPGHPNGTTHGCYVAVHRLVVEEKLGRFLLTTEVVDHIDGNIQNNHPDNLRVFASNADHLRVTLSGHCPKWTEDGKRRISEAVKKRHQMRRDLAAQSTRAG